MITFNALFEIFEDFVLTMTMPGAKDGEEQ